MFAPWLRAISGLSALVVLIILLEKRDQRLKRRRETDNNGKPPDHGEPRRTLNPNPRRPHPTEEEHRSNAEAHWRKQIRVEWIALGLSGIAAGAAIVAGVGAWYTYTQTKEVVREARRQADAAIAGERAWLGKVDASMVGEQPDKKPGRITAGLPFVVKTWFRNSGH